MNSLPFPTLIVFGWLARTISTPKKYLFFIGLRFRNCS